MQALVRLTAVFDAAPAPSAAGVAGVPLEPNGL
jgi:hypothetical protein